MPAEQFDLVVVGGGPAGLNGAIAAARCGARVAVIDEQPQPGGRLHGQVHEEGKGWWKGPEIAARLVEEAVAAGVTIRSGTSVWGLYPQWEVGVQRGGEPVELLQASCVLLATGACQIPLALPGWTLPGVMTAGATHLLVNQYGVRPGRRALVIGTDPLSIMTARFLTWVGTEVLAIVLPPPGPLSGPLAHPVSVLAELTRHAAASPGWVTRLLGRLLGGAGEAGARLAARFYPRAGVPVWNVPLQIRRAALAIEGRGRVEAVTLVDLTWDGRVVPGSQERVEVDLVSTGAGLSPLAELAAQAGCRLVFEEALGGWVPLHGPDLETELDGLFVAGSITGVEGAGVAIAQGRLAGLSIARRLGLMPAPDAGPALERARAAVATARANAPIQFYRDPGAARARLELRWSEARSKLSAKKVQQGS